MSNEITALAQTKNTAQAILGWSPTEVFSADNFGNYTHLWEISKPWVSAPAYVTRNPTGPVPPAQSNQSTPQRFNETARMQAFGMFQGDTEDTYTVKANSDNTFQWKKASVGTYSGSIPINGNSQGIELGIKVRFFATTGFVGTEVWTFYVFRPAFNTGAVYSRWQLVPYLSNLFFVNEYNTLRFLNGRTINTFAWSTDFVPSGRHMVEFQKHLFITEPTLNGVTQTLTVAWSDLREYMKWETQLFINEADQYTFDDTIDCSEVAPGCTGMAELNPVRIGYGPPRLLVYTAKSIHMLEYVGLPLVMKESTLNDKVGCAFPYALAASKSMHLFPAADNFYKLEKDGEATPIGDRVFAAFMHLLSEDMELRYRTYSYVDQVRREVWWVFCSKASGGDFDTKVGYNYISDTWQFAQADEHAFLHCRLPRVAGKTIAEDDQVIEDDTDVIGQAGDSSYQEYRLYGQADKKVSFEVVDTSLTIDQSLDEPFLITGDIIYEPGKIVMIDGMYIHADYDPGSCLGIEVAVSGRAGIEDPVVWKLPPPDKLWTRELKENKYSWPREKGRIFRLRFTFKKKPGVLAVRKAEFFFFNEIVSNLTEQAEK